MESRGAEPGGGRGSRRGAGGEAAQQEEDLQETAAAWEYHAATASSDSCHSMVVVSTEEASVSFPGSSSMSSPEETTVLYASSDSCHSMVVVSTEEASVSFPGSSSMSSPEETTVLYASSDSCHSMVVVSTEEASVSFPGSSSMSSPEETTVLYASSDSCHSMVVVSTEEASVSFPGSSSMSSPEETTVLYASSDSCHSMVVVSTEEASVSLPGSSSMRSPEETAVLYGIIKEVESDSAVSDFSGDSSSDFVPEGSDNETAPSQSSESEVSDDDDNKPQKPQEKAAVVRGRGKAKPKDSEYFVTPDNYFMMNSSKKILTSDRTLARLKNLNLDGNESQDIEISREHKEKIAELNKSYKHLFNRWLFVLNENFNIILYGIGSKKSILDQFQAEKLKDFPCIVINGFFPSLTIKSVLEAIVMDLLGNTYVPSNIEDTVNLIDSQLAENEAELFLIVHNIDGAMLRNAKAQTTLASLSQIRNIHMIATVDHINAPLLWDHSKLGKFRFTWWDVTTFQPYLEETSFETCLLSASSGALQLSSLRSVYQSLTSNAKGIFNVIIEYQVENQKMTHYQGLPFKELYSKCREQFLVSSDLPLRAQLTEFLDHKLVRMKRTLDGSENLVVPIDTALLQQFLEQHT